MIVDINWIRKNWRMIEEDKNKISSAFENPLS